MKRYFLGMAAGYAGRQIWRHTFVVGRQKDRDALAGYLDKRYGGEAILCKNGRSALCMALKAYFDPGDKVIVNGFTCYAVYEAVKAAGLTPVWADISRGDLNFGLPKLEKSKTFHSGHTQGRSAKPTVPNETFLDFSDIRGVIIQNSLGNPVDIEAVEKFAHEHNLVIIEDLAHSAGVRYSDGREAGTVGAGVAFSFGKDKMIDTVSGGAVVLRGPCKHKIKAPTKLPKISDHLRARFYPMFGVICRGLTSVHLGGALMRLLVKIHWVEKSADNRLDLTRKISKFEARLALEQFKNLRKSGEPALREFYLVRDRGSVLGELRQAGYYFDGLWYEKPVSPERYYKKVRFPEAECPEAVFVAEHIVNFPTYYSGQKLAKARKIVEKHLIDDQAKTKEVKNEPKAK